MRVDRIGEEVYARPLHQKIQVMTSQVMPNRFLEVSHGSQ